MKEPREPKQEYRIVATLRIDDITMGDLKKFFMKFMESVPDDALVLIARDDDDESYGLHIRMKESEKDFAKRYNEYKRQLVIYKEWKANEYPKIAAAKKIATAEKKIEELKKAKEKIEKELSKSSSKV